MEKKGQFENISNIIFAIIAAVIVLGIIAYIANKLGLIKLW